MTAGTGITIQDNVISATGGGGETSSFEFYQQVVEGAGFMVYKHTITTTYQSESLTFTSYTFDGGGTEGEMVLTGELKRDLETFVPASLGVSNAALKLTNDGTNIKLINSAPSENVRQQATFTFIKGGTVV